MKYLVVFFLIFGANCLSPIDMRAITNPINAAYPSVIVKKQISLHDKLVLKLSGQPTEQLTAREAMLLFGIILLALGVILLGIGSQKTSKIPSTSQLVPSTEGVGATLLGLLSVGTGVVLLIARLFKKKDA